MATNETEVVRQNQELKHLGFVKVAVIHTFVFASNLYEYAKRNSGSLRSAVGTVEDTVTSVLGPVFDKFKGVPDDLLVFIDNKVDEVTHKLDEQTPPFAKQVAVQAKGLIEEVTHKAGKVINGTASGGPRAALHNVATGSKQFLLIGSVKLWAGLNHYPTFHAVAEMAIPIATHWSDKYNSVIKGLTRKGYTVFGYLPLIPIEDLARAFKQEEGKVKEDETASEGQ